MKKIPIGIKEYRKLIEDDYYVVDKSLLIKEFLDRGNEVTLITRPRRFGKTLNMSMMAEFFDITKDSGSLFEKTNIMKTEYRDRMNQYPTIYISFAGVKGNKDDMIEVIKQTIFGLYAQWNHVFENMNEYDSILYNGIMSQLSRFYNGSLLGIGNSLAFLMNMMEKYYGKKVMVFIDEYDTPFVEAHIGGFYDEIRQPLSSFLHNALKTSTSLQYGMLTGIQRVAKENIFSDLNNLSVYSVRDKMYDQYFGFSEEETTELLKYYGLELNQNVKDMYDGYHIGRQNIYNPWSIMKYAEIQELIPYWLNTSANKMIQSALKEADYSFYNEYEKLIYHGSVDTWVQMETSFFDVNTTPCLWGLFINAGYLTIKKTIDVTDGYYTITIPNQEIQKEFRTLISYYLRRR